jgi:phospholipase C
MPVALNPGIIFPIMSHSSILRFIEDNWKLGRIGDQSFDALAGTLNNLFDFQL